MKDAIDVENIRCGGCANTISKKLLAIDSIESVDVQIDEQRVVIDTKDDTSDKHARQTAIDMLASLGYPEKGSVEGIDSLKGKAKSVVSCAIGKMS